MAHYAKVVNGIVEKVIVADAEFFDTFVDDTPGKWIQTSYNTRGGIHYEANSDTPSSDQAKALRKNFAGINLTTGGNANKTTINTCTDQADCANNIFTCTINFSDY